MTMKHGPGRGFLLAEDYRNPHCKCPMCKSENLVVTTAGIFESSNDDNGYRIKRDQNGAACNCGWSGIVHDMVER